MNLAVAIVLPALCAAVLRAGTPEFAEGEALVKFRGGQPGLQARGSHLQVKRFHGLSQRAGRDFALVSAPGRSAVDLVEELRRNPAVEQVSLNYIRRPAARLPGNDPRFRDLWALLNTGQVVNVGNGTPGADIKWIPAMRLLQPTGEVVVAVIDTGVGYYHEELRNRLWTNTGEIPTNGVDDDANGYVDDVHGYDFSSEATGPDDDAYGHGTQVAGIIAAEWNNAAGIAGVCPQARIMALRALNSGGGATDAQLVEAIDYAVMMKTSGVPVVAINASWGGYGEASFIGAAIADAGDAGIVFCAAAGNDAVDNDVQPFQPASLALSNIVAVTASDQLDQLWHLSNYGATTVDIAAPGQAIVGLVPRGSMVRFTSTTHKAITAIYSPATPGITSIVHDCGHGFATSFPAAVNGNIALIQRGLLPVTAKVANAISAGAIAAVIFNNVSGSFTTTLEDPGAWIPTLTISQEAGLALRALAPHPAEVVVDGRVDFELGLGNGTSWAAPHVAGALALLALAFPGDHVTQRIARVLAGAELKPAFTNRCVTHGRLNLTRSLDTDSDGIGDWWEERHATNLVVMTGSSDTDGDGIPDQAEFTTGTDPQDAGSYFRVAAIESAATHVAIQWEGAPARSYNVYRSTNAPGPWIGIATGLPAALPLTSLTNSPTPAGPAFYHVEVDY